MRKALSSIVLLGALAALGFSPVHANAYCNSSVVIFSHAAVAAPAPVGIVDPGAINENAGVCAIDNSDNIYDTRFINPGSTAINIRFTGQLDASVTSLNAVIDGLGFNQQAITLNRISSTQGLITTYDSDLLFIPAGPTGTGSITATVTLPDGSTDTTTFHTVGS
ncbi:MAG: hypothetical protein ACYDCC_01495 [Actinomycetota bacterium]